MASAAPQGDVPYIGPERRGPDAPASDPPRPLIVKKIIVQQGNGHHGGAWKVAYADFVTAMMAFFLLLWLLGATTEDQRKGLADYFTPTLVKLKEESAGADGLLGGSSITDVDSYPNAAGQTGTRELTIPRDALGGPKEAHDLATPRQLRARELKREIEEALQADRSLRNLAGQVRVMASPEGVRIDLVDDADFSMFALGTTVLVPRAEELIATIAATISDLPTGIIVRGHTDSLPWKPGVAANNWSLSAGRAEATRQSLIRSGIGAGRFSRIEGVADREHLVAADPADPRNRRISILLLD